MVCTSTFSSPRFPLFFFQPAIVDFVNCEQYICVLFMVSQITLFSNFFIKNESHNTIYIFKNYFATVFSVSVFNFNKNKLNQTHPNYFAPVLYIPYQTLQNISDTLYLIIFHILLVSSFFFSFPSPSYIFIIFIFFFSFSFFFFFFFYLDRKSVV